MEENIYELISHDKTGIFAKEIILLRELLNIKPVTGIEGEKGLDKETISAKILFKKEDTQ